MSTNLIPHFQNKAFKTHYVDIRNQVEESFALGLIFQSHDLSYTHTH